MKRSVAGICIVGVMAVIIGVTAIIGISTVNDSYYWGQSRQRESLPSIAKILEQTQRLKDLPRVALDAENEEIYKAIPVLQEGVDSLADFEGYFFSFDVTIVDAETRECFDGLKEAYYNEYKPSLFGMLEQARIYSDEHRYQLREFIEPLELAASKMADYGNRCMYIVSDSVAADTDRSFNTAEYILVIIAVLIVIEVSISVAFIIATARYSRSQNPAGKNMYRTNGAPYVYAMYPVDPSNPANPPNATHIMYPIIYPYNPAQPNEPQRFQE